MENKILIIVRDGIVQAVHISQDAKIVIMDIDEDSEEKTILGNIVKPDSVQSYLYPLFGEPEDWQIRAELKNYNF